MGVVNDIASLFTIGPNVVMYWCMINFLDFAPNSMRRRILSGEYQGEALEQRLQLKIGGGWRMFKALWRMSSVNMRPAVTQGDVLPSGTVVASIDDNNDALIDLAALSRGSKTPLVINFGSCS
jgi:hypothetical protein